MESEKKKQVLEKIIAILILLSGLAIFLNIFNKNKWLPEYINDILLLFVSGGLLVIYYNKFPIKFNLILILLISSFLLILLGTIARYTHIFTL